MLMIGTHLLTRKGALRNTRDDADAKVEEKQFTAGTAGYGANTGARKWSGKHSERFKK